MARRRFKLINAPSDGGGGAEVNDLTSAVTWANVPDINITETSVTQHEAALTITESQISDLGTYLTDAPSDGETYGRLDGAWSIVDSGTTLPNGTASGSLGDLLYWDSGAGPGWNDTNGAIRVNVSTPPVGGRIRVNGSSSSDVTRPALYVDVGSSVSGIWYAETSASGTGFWSQTIGNATPDRQDWGVDIGGLDTRLFSIGHDFSFRFYSDTQFLIEGKSAADTPVANYGEIWVRNDTTNVLMFTDEDGTDFVLNSAGGANIIEPANDLVGSVPYWDDVAGEYAPGQPTRGLQITLPSVGTTQLSTGDSIMRLNAASQVVVPGTFRAAYTDANDNIGFAEVGVNKQITTGVFGGDLMLSSGNGSNMVRLFDGSTFGIEERSSALTDIAGVGQIWVRNDTPNVLMFTDDAGTDFVLNASGGGTVTSVAAGNGMDFTTITGSGTVTLGTPEEIGTATGNTVSATGHTHALASNIANINTGGTGGGAADRIPYFIDSNSLRGDANFTWDTSTLAVTGAIDVTGTIDGSSSIIGQFFESHGTTPGYLLRETDAGANEKEWAILSAGDTFQIQTQTDVGGFGDTLLSATRTGTTIGTLTLAVPTDVQGNLDVTGNITLTGTVDGVDVAARDHNAVTITGEDFLSLSTQQITANPINLDNLSATGTPSSSTYLRGDNTWATLPAGGNVSNTGTPVNNQIGVWTNATTLEGTSTLTWDGTNFLVGGFSDSLTMSPGTTFDMEFGSLVDILQFGVASNLDEIELNATTIDMNGNLDVLGNITVTGTVDGVDVAALSASNALKAPLASPTFTGTVTTAALSVSGEVSGAGIQTTGSAPAASKILKSHTNGYTYVGWLNTVSGNTTAAFNRIYVNSGGSDAFLRYCTPAHFASVLDGESWTFTSGNIHIGSTDTTLTRKAAGVLGIENKAAITHANTAFTSSEVTVSTSAPTGGANGDIWLQY